MREPKSLMFRINRTVPPVTLRHYYPVAGRLPDRIDSPEAWDRLRDAEPHLSIADERGEWLKATALEVVKDGQDARLIERAQDVVRFLEHAGVRELFSVAVGGAGLEYHIKRLYPAVRLTCSEYAPENVRKLKRVFPEADAIVQQDARNSDWSSLSDRADACVLVYRLDPHLTDPEWRSFFVRLSAQRVRTVLYIPSRMLTWLSIVERVRTLLRWRREGAGAVFAGYTRSRPRFQSFWKSLYTPEIAEFGGLEGFILRLG